MRLVASTSLTPPPQQFCLVTHLANYMGKPPEFHTRDDLLQGFDIVSFQVWLILRDSSALLFCRHLEFVAGVLVDIPISSQNVLNRQHLSENTQEHTDYDGGVDLHFAHILQKNIQIKIYRQRNMSKLVQNEAHV